MKKVLALLFSFSVFNISVDAQVAIEWQKCYGGTSNDIGYKIKPCSDGGYIVLGNTQSNDFDVSGNKGSDDIWVLKIDSIGGLQWQKCFGGSLIDAASDFIQTPDRGYIILGSTQSIDGDITGNHGSSDFWLVKTDSIGNLLWQKCFGGSDVDIPLTISQTFDGGYIMAGYSESANGDVTGNHGYIDSWVVKTDSIGTLQWQKNYGGSGGDLSIGVHQTKNNEFILFGSSSSTNGDVTGNHGNEDIWVVKIDSLGLLLWEKSYGGTESDGCATFQQTSDGGYIIAGSSRSNNGDVTGLHGTNNYSDYWLLEIDSNGTLLWQNTYGGLSWEEGLCVKQTSDGGLILIGNATLNGSGINFNLGQVTGHHGYNDGWLVKTDSIGSFEWQKCIGGTGYEGIYSIQIINDGSYIITGITNSTDGDANKNNGLCDLWVVKLSEKQNTINGHLFVDQNLNSAKDSGELFMKNQEVFELNSGISSFSFDNGEYNLIVTDSGNYTIAAAPLSYYNIVPFTHNAYFSGINQKDSINDFGYQPAGVFNDLCVRLSPVTPFRAGMNAQYKITYENAGTTTLSPIVIFYPDSNITFANSNPPSTSVTMDSAVWDLGPLPPLQNGNIFVNVNVVSGLPIGTLIYPKVTIQGDTNDPNPGCNNASWEVYTRGSFDPNAILVDRNSILTSEIPNPDFLEYIIFFQNTGNDTAFTITILNNLPEELDVSSFEFLASSFPVKIDYGPYARLLNFKFNNILLPDSNVNEKESHGFIRYRIKPLTTLHSGDSINNMANIYFDSNRPETTNTANTVIILPAGIVSFPKENKTGLKLFPNPASESITIQLTNPKETIREIKIHDLLGRTIFDSKVRAIHDVHKNTTSPSLLDFTAGYKIQTDIDISGFQTGIYIIEVLTGKNTYRGRVIKQ